MNRPPFLGFRGGLVVHRIAQQVEDTPQGFVAHRDGNGSAGIHSLQAANQAVRRTHSNTAYNIVADMLCYFYGYSTSFMFNLDCIEKIWKALGWELNVENRADNRYYRPYILFTHWLRSFSMDCLREHPWKAQYSAFTRDAALLRCLCARDDFGNFLCNCALSGSVVF